MLPRLNGNYQYSQNDSTAGQTLFIPQTGGLFRFRAPGGEDVGTAEAAIRADNPMVWNEHTTITTVNRSQPLTVTWRGGTPGGFVVIQGGSFTTTGDIYNAFGCTVATEAGRFTVPRDVLASMVPSATLGGVATGQLLVEHFTLPTRFTVTGLDHGSIVWESYSGTTVTYQ